MRVPGMRARRLREAVLVGGAHSRVVVIIPGGTMEASLHTSAERASRQRSRLLATVRVAVDGGRRGELLAALHVCSRWCRVDE